MYKPYYDNTGIAILFPTIELLLAVRCFPVVSLWICSDKIVERSLQRQSITSLPLIRMNMVQDQKKTKHCNEPKTKTSNKYTSTSDRCHYALRIVDKSAIQSKKVVCAFIKHSRYTISLQCTPKLKSCIYICL